MSKVTLPTSMKALIHNFRAESLELTSVDLPTPSPTEHLLRVHAVTLSAGELTWKRPEDLNESVPGVDVAGEIVTSPPKSRFRPGDHVYARTQFPRPGSAREYTLVLEHELALQPSNITTVEAATVPMSAETAWQSLFVQAGFSAPENGKKPDENASKRVLVIGASGGCGIWLVQLAKAAGLYVVGTCGPSNKQFVLDLGADEVLDYSEIGPKAWAAADETRKVNLAVDCVGGKSLEEAWTAVKDGGLVLTIVPTPGYADPEKPSEGVGKDVTGRFFIMTEDGKQLEECTRLIEAGTCRPAVDSVWRFDEWEKAFEKVNRGHARGKVVLQIYE